MLDIKLWTYATRIRPDAGVSTRKCGILDGMLRATSLGIWAGQSLQKSSARVEICCHKAPKASRLHDRSSQPSLLDYIMLNA